MTRFKTSLNVSLTEKEKEFIKKKAGDLGFSSASSFLLDASKTYFRLDMDMSAYRQLTKEINYIGKNINSLMRRINTDGFYTDMEIDFFKSKLNQIYKLMNREYRRLTDLKFNFSSDNLDLKKTEILIQAMKEKKMKIPKELLFGEVFERIREDFDFLIKCLDDSPKQEKELSEFVWDYLYSNSIVNLNEDSLIELYNELFILSEKIKFKTERKGYCFSDDDWFELKEIIDKYQ
ncbi:hypothetical protein [Enterococcus sp. AZ196]|uniref:hypothetical protein n=1 Tax=Enterococcus sp. AZ196 TaxID=2774659 RepID=UPI003D2C1752